MDITQLILDDHHEQRRQFAVLEQIDASDARTLGAIWARLAAFLEIHAEAEEQIFYPALLRVGEGAGGKPDAQDETEHAIRDHNKIRDAVAAVKKHSVGSAGWFAAVAAANKENGDHMAEEEREGLTGGRPRLPCATSSPWPSPRSRRFTSPASRRSIKTRKPTSPSTRRSAACT
jgi:hypothetical protein